ncbi:MAG: immune inhibitor A [Anaerolineae bacterium]|nr:immune inhibitor A [Anaerolineae bacterium]
MIRRMIAAVIAMCAWTTVLAQSTDPLPAIPPRDRAALARELLGVTVTELPAPALATVGDRRTFYAMDIESGERRGLQAEMIAAGSHATLWAETPDSIDVDAAASLLQQFDDVVYPAVREMWGSEDIPGIDGDPRLMIVFVEDVESGTAAYYSSSDRYPSEIVPLSSEADLFFVSSALVGNRLDRPQVVATLAHEFQHMIRDHRGERPQTWLNEGLSTYTELALGLLPSDWAFSTFQRSPGIQLTDWSLEENRGAHYGAAGLFVTYVADRFGRDGVTALAAGEGPGLAPVRAMLTMVDPTLDAETVIADWTAANFLRAEGSAAYGYRSVTLPVPDSRPVEQGETIKTSLPPYAAAYYTLDLAGAGVLTVDVNADIAVPMLPASPASGDHFWVPLRADDSAAALTREFDLASASTPELRFDVWYDLEDNYDYLLLTATTDSGATWQVLEPDSAVDSPYGPALTGYSGGWRTERVSLENYAGQRVRVRWLVVTDDALTEPGVALDDIAVDAIEFHDDTEQGVGDWSAAGWVLTDNRIEASVWVQVMQRTGSGVRVDRQRVYGSGRLDVAVAPDAREVAIAVTPLADMTTEPISVALTIQTLPD